MAARHRRIWDGFLDVGLWLLFFALLVPAGLVGYAIGTHREDKSGSPAAAAPSTIKPAPAFSADELTREPKDAWLTNGGSLLNQRYSPLDQIDTGNVKNLKGVWLTNLKGSGVAAKYSAEGQPIVYEGVIYVPTGEDDVFAVSVETGEILWEYHANLEQTIN
ncbi:MAG: quinohemoprotein ethanol dehydrogenase, partial [Gaiellaceae bacterium]|nr:quinohemoprotein ethanol dehydrogenase [Gaiellaceae bacterium]